MFWNEISERVFSSFSVFSLRNRNYPIQILNYEKDHCTIFCYFCFTKFWLESNGASVDLEARRHLFVASLIWAWCRISLNPTHCLICSTNICFFGFGKNGKCSTTARFVNYSVVHVCELKMFHQKGCSRLASRVCSRQGNVSPDGEDSFGRVSSWQICLPGARN